MTLFTSRSLVSAVYLALAMGVSTNYVHAKTPAPVAYQAVTQEQIMQKPTAAEVLEIVYSPKQSSLFVSSPNWEDETLSRTLVLDPMTLAIQQEIPMDVKSFGVALDDAADRLYLTQGFNGGIAVVDTARKELIKRIAVQEKINFQEAIAAADFGQARKEGLLKMLERFNVTEDFQYKMRELVVDKKNHRVFAPGLGLGFDSVLFVVNTQTMELEKVLPGFGYNVVGITLDEANNRLFVSNMQGQIMVVNSQTLNIDQVWETQADQLLNLSYDPEHNRLFGVDQGIDRDDARNLHLEREYKRRSPGHQVFVLDASNGKTLAVMPTGEVPIGLRFDAASQRLFVANRGGVREKEGKGSVSVFDTVNYKPLQTIELAPHPNSLEYIPAEKALYVSVKNDGNSKEKGTKERMVRIQF
ncbi:YncE family protein [Alcaligenes aquatilis]|uniref:YncE family protein n=1 Tax=Alcaligenes aquatilis TaxID=323284 RepID=UPI00360FC71C